MYANPAHFDVASNSFAHFYIFHASTTRYKIKTIKDRVLEFSHHEDGCTKLNITYIIIVADLFHIHGRPFKYAHCNRRRRRDRGVILCHYSHVPSHWHHHANYILD